MASGPSDISCCEGFGFRKPSQAEARHGRYQRCAAWDALSLSAFCLHGGVWGFRLSIPQMARLARLAAHEMQIWIAWRQTGSLSQAASDKNLQAKGGTRQPGSEERNVKTRLAC